MSELTSPSTEHEPSPSVVTRLLRDLPVDTDSFGPHERVASAIAEMVANEPGGIAIAVEGSWGSGKSTIVHILDRKTSDDVFVFDAWAHEDDPLRRVFLESLIDHCWPNLNDQQKKSWMDEKDCLSKRRRSVTTESQPRITRTTALVVAFSSAYPLALIVSAAAFRQESPWAWWQWLAIGYAILPILIGLITWFKLGKKTPSEASKAGLIQLWIHKADSTVKSDSTESSEPTSIEFQSIFVRLMEDYLADADRRLVIVLDNLDRLPHDRAVSLWSTLRVFMDCWESERHNWASRTWLLVPYDRPAVQRLWETDTQEDDNSVDHEDEFVTPPGTPAAFLDKTFQIRFEVPPLILADWKEYLFSLLSEAFPDHSDEAERHFVYRISALVAEEKGRPPTPRHLKLYVNDIGALRRQFHDQFPLHHLAYYAILRRKDVPVRNGLLRGRVPETAFVHSLNDDVADHLAAICFNTSDVEKAQDLLLREPILQALQSGEAKQLGDLAQRRGFWPIAESVLPDAASKWAEEPENAANAARAVFDSKLKSAEGHPEASSTVCRFARKIVETTKWKASTDSVVNGMVALLHLAESPLVVRQLALSLVSAELDDIAEGEEKPSAQVVNRAQHLATFMEACTALGHESAIGPELKAGGSATTVVHLCNQLAEHNSSRPLWKYLQANIQASDILEVLKPTSAAPHWTPVKANAITVLKHSRVRINWSDLAAAIQSALETTETIKPRIIELLIRATYGMANQTAQQKANAARKSLAASGHLHHHLNNCKGDEAIGTAALLVYEIALAADIGSTPATVGTSAAGHQWLTSIVEAPGEHVDLVNKVASILPRDEGAGFIARLLGQQPTTAALAIGCMKHLDTSNKLAEIVSHGLYRKKRVEIRKLLRGNKEISYGEFVAAHVNDGRILQALVESEYNRNETMLCSELLDAGGTNIAAFKDWVREQLRTSDKDTWASTLLEDGDQLELLRAYRECDESFVLGADFGDAVEFAAREVLAGNWNGEVSGDRWAAVLGSIPNANLRVMGKNLLDAVNRPDDQAYGPFFGRFGDVLAAPEECSEPAKLVRLVYMKLIQSNEASGLEWLATSLEGESNLVAYRQAPAEDRTTFEERIIDTLTNHDPVSDAVQRIANKLDLKIAVSEQEESDDDGIKEEGE